MLDVVQTQISFITNVERNSLFIHNEKLLNALFGEPTTFQVACIPCGVEGNAWLYILMINQTGCLVNRYVYPICHGYFSKYVYVFLDFRSTLLYCTNDVKSFVYNGQTC